MMTDPHDTHISLREDDPTLTLWKERRDRLLRRLCAESNVVGMEIVELNPLVDPTYVTPLVANRCGREMLTGVAMRKKGLTEPHYLAPETVDHGQG